MNTTTVKREFYIEANGREVSDEQYKRIVNAKPQRESKRDRAALNSNRGFSLMR